MPTFAPRNCITVRDSAIALSSSFLTAASSGSPYTNSNGWPAWRSIDAHRCWPTREHELTFPSPGLSGVAHRTMGPGHACIRLKASCPFPIDGCSITRLSQPAA